jgi:hypothetical protein
MEVPAYDRNGSPRDNDSAGDLVYVEGLANAGGRQMRVSLRETHVKAR